jgi:Recombination endonuclease VII
MRTVQQKKANAEASKRWRRSHLDASREYSREKSRKWRREHPELNRENCKEWQKAHPDKRRAIHHQYLYNEPIENKIARLEAQGYKCANSVCLAPIDLTTGHQDHNHKTNENRGVLCSKCNHALGLLSDSASMAEGLAEYRRRFM